MHSMDDTLFKLTSHPPATTIFSSRTTSAVCNQRAVFISMDGDDDDQWQGRPTIGPKIINKTARGQILLLDSSSSIATNYCPILTCPSAQSRGHDMYTLVHHASSFHFKPPLYSSVSVSNASREEETPLPPTIKM
uniref:Uncharacterized protein n=1 Tax=Leptocylindrus danicus TaxID=163516 RepID=A0A7S2KNS4_9STRA